MPDIKRYKEDLANLVQQGNMLHMALQAQYRRAAFVAAAREQIGDEEEVTKYLADLPRFDSDYQAWYSEVKGLVRQLLPDRLEDLARHYERPRSRKDITFENYTIEDGLQGLTITRGCEQTRVVGPEAMLPRFQQQLAILKSVERRFESSLLEIRQIAQADLFDSELEAAEALLKAKHVRAAGVVAGVVLEAHLSEVRESRREYSEEASQHQRFQ